MRLPEIFAPLLGKGYFFFSGGMREEEEGEVGALSVEEGSLLALHEFVSFLAGKA